MRPTGVVGLSHANISRRWLVVMARLGQDRRMTLKLLIVEDSEPIRVSLMGLLACIPGIRSVHLAVNLASAMERAREVPPTLVVLDLHLPDGMGCDLIQPIKKLVPGVRIAMLTNHASDLHKRHCLEGGADWFFDKSTEFENLLELVRGQAARRASQPR